MKLIDINNIQQEKVKEYCYSKQNMKHLAKYKNKYKGKRVFLIGNGPSLIIEDLEKLKKQNGDQLITFLKIQKQ